MAHVVTVVLGTQTCKATVYDDGLAARGVGRVAIATTHPRPGWAEQDPHAWEQAVGAAIAAALADAGLAAAAISALGFTGQLDGMIAVDAAGAPLSPCWPWSIAAPSPRCPRSIAIASTPPPGRSPVPATSRPRRAAGIAPALASSISFTTPKIAESDFSNPS